MTRLTYEERCRLIGMTPFRSSERTLTDLIDASPGAAADYQQSVFARPTPLSQAQREAIARDLQAIEDFRSGKLEQKALTLEEAKQVMSEYRHLARPSIEEKALMIAATGIVARNGR